jgi:hydroxymethylpyrimidine pyrophosphatase-like HAD family hydrolase
MGWILETNKAMNRGMQAMGGRIVKRYRMYEQASERPAAGHGRRRDAAAAGRQRVPARARGARAARAAGLRVVLATARPGPGRAAARRRPRAGGHAICLGGAQRYDLDRGALVGEDRLDHATATAVLGALRAAHPDVLVVAEVGLDIHVEHGFSLGDWGFRDLPAHTVRGSLAELDPGVTALLAGHAHVPLDELELVAGAAAAGRAAITRSGGPHIEVFAPGVSKGAGLAALCAELGSPGRRRGGRRPPQRRRDGPLGRARRGGGQRGPELLAAADGVVPANADDGVAVLVEELLASG